MARESRVILNKLANCLPINLFSPHDGLAFKEETPTLAINPRTLNRVIEI